MLEELPRRRSATEDALSANISTYSDHVKVSVTALSGKYLIKGRSFPTSANTAQLGTCLRKCFYCGSGIARMVFLDVDGEEVVGSPRLKEHTRLAIKLVTWEEQKNAKPIRSLTKFRVGIFT